MSSRAELVIEFIETLCIVPDGNLVGQPMQLDAFQKKFIRDVYDNPHGTTTAILSLGRKNGKTALIAALVLVHLVGPEARLNSELVSGARSRTQAGQVFKLASKMVRLSPVLKALVHIKPSKKTLIGLPLNVEYEAISAEAATALGGSPVVAILDEVGQVRGPRDDFVDAITTSQGAHKNPLLIAISTQAANDGDLFSIWIDDAKKSNDPHIVSHVYTAPIDCKLDDETAWKAANPALGLFRSLADVEQQARKAMRLPSEENTFRNLVLNQRISRVSPFMSQSVWDACGGPVNVEAFSSGIEVLGGLDLSMHTDLTSLELICEFEEKWHVLSFFWTPEDGLLERAKRDREPYDIWVKQGLLRTTPGASVDYEYVASDLAEILGPMNVKLIAFDRYRMDVLKKDLDRIGLELPLSPMGQGFKDMTPALDTFETEALNGRIAHGMNPVLRMCMRNAVVSKGVGRKLDKMKGTGRMDGAQALAMAFGAVNQALPEPTGSVYNDIFKKVA